MEDTDTLRELEARLPNTNMKFVKDIRRQGWHQALDGNDKVENR